MTVQFRASTTATNPASTTLTINAPTGLAEGDLLVMSLLTENNAGTVPTPPSDDWTRVYSELLETGFRMSCFIKTAGASEPASYDLTGLANAASGDAKCVLEAYYDTVGGGLWGVSADTWDFQVAATPNNITVGTHVTIDNCMLLMQAGCDGFETLNTAPSGMTESGSRNEANAAIYTYYEAITTGGNTDKTFEFADDAVGGFLFHIYYETGIRLREDVTDATNPSSTTLTINKPSGTVEGDLMILSLLEDHNGTPTGPSGWTAIVSEAFQTSFKQYSWYKVAGASEPASYDITNLGSHASQYGHAVLRTFYGNTGGGTWGISGSYAHTGQASAAPNNVTVGPHTSVDSSVLICDALSDGIGALNVVPDGMFLTGQRTDGAGQIHAFHAPIRTGAAESKTFEYASDDAQGALYHLTYTVSGSPTPDITSMSATIRSKGSVTFTGTDFEATQGTGNTEMEDVSMTETAWADLSVTSTVPDVETTAYGYGSRTWKLTNDNDNNDTYSATVLPESADHDYVVLAGTLATTGLRWTATPALSVGDQIRYDTRVYQSDGVTLASPQHTISTAADASITLTSGDANPVPSGTYKIKGNQYNGSTWTGEVQQEIEVSAGDTTPDAFSFTDQTDIAQSTQVESNTITVAGIDASTPISISTTDGCEYRINGGSYVSTAGNVVNGDTVQLRVTSSASYSTAVSGTLDIGGVSDNWTVTTEAAPDTTPDAFNFTDQTDVSQSTVTESNIITVAGIDASTPISISTTDGMEYRINGGAYTATSGNVVNGDTVQLRVTSSASYSTAVSGTLDIGGVTDQWDVTTEAAPDTTPDAFSFTDQTNVGLSNVIESNTITVAGINQLTPISISTTAGMEFRINGGVYTSTSTNLSNGDTVQLRVTSSGSFNTAVTGTLDIGGVTDEWSVTTQASADSTPPVIVLDGDNPMDIQAGETWVEPGYTATDDTDGVITGSVVVAGDAVNTAVLGAYNVTYDVDDAAGNSATQVVRTVNVIDTTPPVINLNGSGVMYHLVTTAFTDPGATASDNLDGDLTGSIVVGGDTVDQNTVGTYVITYNVSDSETNAAVEKTRTVYVVNELPSNEDKVVSTSVVTTSIVTTSLISNVKT